MRNDTVSTGAPEKAGVGLVCLDEHAKTGSHYVGTRGTEPTPPTNDTEQD